MDLKKNTASWWNLHLHSLDKGWRLGSNFLEMIHSSLRICDSFIFSQRFDKRTLRGRNITVFLAGTIAFLSTLLTDRSFPRRRPLGLGRSAAAAQAGPGGRRPRSPRVSRPSAPSGAPRALPALAAAAPVASPSPLAHTCGRCWQAAPAQMGKPGGGVGCGVWGGPRGSLRPFPALSLWAPPPAFQLWSHPAQRCGPPNPGCSLTRHPCFSPAPHSSHTVCPSLPHPFLLKCALPSRLLSTCLHLVLFLVLVPNIRSRISLPPPPPVLWSCR